MNSEQTLELINKEIEVIQRESLIHIHQKKKADEILAHDHWTLLTQSPLLIRVHVGKGAETKLVELAISEEGIKPVKKKKPIDWDEHSFAALRLCQANARWFEQSMSGIRYTREGMITRVLGERKDKAHAADYKVRLAKNLYGEHQLINERGSTFHITLWDFNKRTGYINNVDWRTNKLATTKHIIFLYDYLDKHPRKTNKLEKAYPFIDITLDPLNEYKISYYYPEKLKKKYVDILSKCFGTKTYLEDNQIPKFLSFLNSAREEEFIKIRPEVLEKVEDYFNTNSYKDIYNKSSLNYSQIKTTLYPYQKEGIEFALPKSGAIIADEMGLGKTIQAISVAILKKDLYAFTKTLVICPASIKYQWKNEIEKFTDEKAIVIEGFPEDRSKLYMNPGAYFSIINYETVLRDLESINKAGYDFVILDEAQKIKNFNTKTAQAIKKIKKQHALIITGTPIENKLVDLYSVVQFIDPYLLTPLWEFSYQYCLFHAEYKNRITGYYNLTKLKDRLKPIIIRREKRSVLDQLPTVNQKNIYVALHPEQARYHASSASGVAKILSKKFKTIYDWQRLMLLLTSMRMACDSTFLVDKETHYSSKLVELEHVLVNLLDLRNNDRKVIIFSEWITMLHIIGDLLKRLELGFVMLTGKVPVKKRGLLIKEFEENDDCRVFLSTESGGTGLNLQMADIVINYELPWNPAKKNQRIGRIDRLGQKSNKLTVINFICINSIESKIAMGLALKQNLFDGVLSEKSNIDSVDFSEKGRAQFIKQLEEMMGDLETGQIIDETDEAAYDTGDLELLSQTDMEIPDESKPPNDNANQEETNEKYEQLEEVLNKGMEFLSGIYQMSSGKKLDVEDKQTIQVNKETGEVTMTFKVNI